MYHFALLQRKIQNKNKTKKTTWVTIENLRFLIGWTSSFFLLLGGKTTLTQEKREKEKIQLMVGKIESDKMIFLRQRF